MIRAIVRIDQEKCDGCGDCVPACHEGAIEIVDGLARLASERLCDGIGDCLGHCPRGAITVERREAPAYDDELVAARLAATAPATVPPAQAAQHGCLGSRQLELVRPEGSAAEPGGDGGALSELSQWPVQIQLLAPDAPRLRGARLLVAADCVPFAYPAFHARMLRGRALMIGCPKLDDLGAQVAKLTEVVRRNGLQDIVVARMEVPCCTGILTAVLEARRRAGLDVPVRALVVGIRGQVLAQEEHPAHATS